MVVGHDFVGRPEEAGARARGHLLRVQGEQVHPVLEAGDEHHRRTRVLEQRARQRGRGERRREEKARRGRAWKRDTVLCSSAVKVGGRSTTRAALPDSLSTGGRGAVSTAPSNTASDAPGANSSRERLATSDAALPTSLRVASRGESAGGCGSLGVGRGPPDAATQSCLARLGRALPAATRAHDGGRAAMPCSML